MVDDENVVEVMPDVVDDVEDTTIDAEFKELNSENDEDNTNLESWEQYGFLHQIPDEQKIPLAMMYEEFLQEIVNNQNFISQIDKVSHWSEVLNSFYDQNMNFDVLELVMFPLIKRIFVIFNGEVTWEEIKEALENTSLINFHKNNDGVSQQLENSNLSLDSIDYEATLCAIYSDIIAAKIMIQRKNTKKWKK